MPSHIQTTSDFHHFGSYPTMTQSIPSPIFDGDLLLLMAAICPGNNQQPVTLSPFFWPVLKCINYCICIIGDCLQNIPTDHSINIFVVPREM